MLHVTKILISLTRLTYLFIWFNFKYLKDTIVQYFSEHVKEIIANFAVIFALQMAQ